jgi:hypothetical protein
MQKKVDHVYFDTKYSGNSNIADGYIQEYVVIHKNDKDVVHVIVAANSKLYAIPIADVRLDKESVDVKRPEILPE